MEMIRGQVQVWDSLNFFLVKLHVGYVKNVDESWLNNARAWFGSTGQYGNGKACAYYK